MSVDAIVPWKSIGGWIEIHATERVENGVWILGGRVVERDHTGKVVSVKTHDNVRIDLDGIHERPSIIP